jgi:hypothetical protein
LVIIDSSIRIRVQRDGDNPFYNFVENDIEGDIVDHFVYLHSGLGGIDIRLHVLLVVSWGTPAAAAVAGALGHVDFAERRVFSGGGLYPVEENVYRRRNTCCENGQP